MITEAIMCPNCRAGMKQVSTEGWFCRSCGATVVKGVRGGYFYALNPKDKPQECYFVNIGSLN